MVTPGPQDYDTLRTKNQNSSESRIKEGDSFAQATNAKDSGTSSRVGYAKFRSNPVGLLVKVKHLREIDSELALRGKGEKNCEQWSETDFEITCP